MKRLLTVLLVAILTFAFYPACSLAVEGDTGDDGFFSWRELADGTVEVTDYSFTGPRAVDIPDTLAGRSVTAVSENAFLNDTITSVVIPDSMKSVGNGAFSRCSGLVSITFGSGLESIGDSAFYQTALTSLSLPDRLKTIGREAFFLCYSLASVTFGGELKTIGQEAFRHTALTSVTFPDSLEEIGLAAFTECGSLHSVEFGSSLLSIGESAFSNCPIDTHVLLPDSLKTIGASAFSGCTSFSSVTFGRGLATIGDGAFSLTGIASATLPDSLETIGNYAFDSCPNLTSVTFGSSLLSIGDGAFSNTPIQVAALPDSLLSIGSSAFGGCTDLTSLKFGNSLETIGQWAFSQSSITNLVLPASLKTLGFAAFLDSALLSKAVFLGEAGMLSSGAFLGCPMTEGVWGFGGSAAQSTFAFYPFHYLYRVSFDTTGGTAVEDAVAEEGALISKPADPARTYYTFGGWFKDSALTDAWDFTADKVTGTTTLYAMWTAHPVLASSDANGKIIMGEQITLIPNIPNGVWSFDTSFLSRDGNTFTGLKAGTTRIEYTIDGQSVFYDLMIDQALALQSADSDGMIYTGGRITLTPNISGGTWSFDASFLSRDGNTFTGLKAGKTRVVYTAEEQSAYYDIAIKIAALPQTGQESTMIIVFLSISLLLFGISTILGKIRPVKK